MKTLSYTQEFFLCTINDKGKIPALKGEIPACLAVSGIMELLSNGYLNRAEKDKLAAGKPWDDSLPYLKPLYETIVSLKKPLDIKDILMIYIGGFVIEQFYELYKAIGVSLVESGYADELTKKGLIKEKPRRYVPKEEAIKNVVEKVRAEFLEDGMITEETLCLAAFLDASGLISNYFSKFEAEAMKKRIKEARESGAYALVKEAFDVTIGIKVISTSK